MSDDFENENESVGAPAPEAGAEAPLCPATEAPASQSDDGLDWEQLRNEFEAKTASRDAEAETPAFNWEQFQHEQELQQRASEIDGYANQLNEVAAQIDYAQDKLRVDQLLDRLAKGNADFGRQDRQTQLGVLSSIYHASEAARAVWLNGSEDQQKTLEREVSRYLTRLYDEVREHALKEAIDPEATATREAVSAAVRWASSANPPPPAPKNFSEMSESEFRREVTRATGFSLD